MKILLLFNFIALPFGIFCQSDSFTTFSSKNYQISYPDLWEFDTSKMMGTTFFIFSPLENDSDTFRENVNFVIQDLSGQDINLETYKQISDAQFENLLKKEDIIESTIIKSGQKEYFRASYLMTQGKFRLKITSICYLANKKAYLLTFTSELSKYDSYKETGEKILASFKLIE